MAAPGGPEARAGDGSRVDMAVPGGPEARAGGGSRHRLLRAIAPGDRVFARPETDSDFGQRAVTGGPKARAGPGRCAGWCEVARQATESLHGLKPTRIWDTRSSGAPSRGGEVPVWARSLHWHTDWVCPATESLIGLIPTRFWWSTHGHRGPWGPHRRQVATPACRKQCGGSPVTESLSGLKPTRIWVDARLERPRRALPEPGRGTGERECANAGRSLMRGLYPGAEAENAGAWRGLHAVR